MGAAAGGALLVVQLQQASLTGGPGGHDTEKCVKCLRCFLVCPDGAIDKSGTALEIDYDYCKGCGVCSRACKLGAITMIKEAEV